MDTTRIIYKPLIHKYPLFPSAMFIQATCGGCHVHEPIYGGYFCNETFTWFHKECAKAPLEINHTSHSNHPLLLTNDIKDGLCNLCGEKLVSPCYSCPKCEFNVDLICGIKPSPCVIEHPVCHDHPLVFLKKGDVYEEVCEVCKESNRGPSYSCFECHVYFHVHCVHLSKEVNHLSHSTHPLKLIASESLRDDDIAEKKCNFCFVQPQNMIYHCFLCNFTMCLCCTKNPPPLIIEHTKTHKHPLALISYRIKFICKVCGIENHHTMAYICLQCNFLVDLACINLPRVTNINRHDHRISFTYHLGKKSLKCGVCRKSVSQYYGAYSCSICPNYAVHSKCAIDTKVWDFVELEGIPEVNEDIAPYKVVGDNLINHFSHEEHTLRLYKDILMILDNYEYVRCQACISPAWYGSIYICEKCGFILHEKCANLPKKKKLVFDHTPYTLECNNSIVYCYLCGVLSTGFKYRGHERRTSHLFVDVHCGSVYEPFNHDGHLHPLYFYKLKYHRCNACKKKIDGYVLRCEVCDFDLCLYCATLPQKIWHKVDNEHPLTLYCGGEVKGNNSCEVCEKEINTRKWFFTCNDCGIFLHVRCVLGDFSRLKPGMFMLFRGKYYKVVFNNRNTRPLCSQCHFRCEVSIILKDYSEDDVYICSNSCLSSFIGIDLLTLKPL